MTSERAVGPRTPEERLLLEDNSEIRLVPDAARAMWFRPPRSPEYFCERCDRYHRTWSAIGERHDPKVKP